MKKKNQKTTAKTEQLLKCKYRTEKCSNNNPH